MPRYAQQQPLSDRSILDGDNLFLGFSSRRQSQVLEPGVLELSKNLRLDRQTAKARAGIEPAVTDVEIDNAPVILSYTFGYEYTVASLTSAGTTCTCTIGSAHGYSTGNFVEIRGATQTDYNGVFAITVTGATTFTYTAGSAPSASPATTSTVIYAATGPRIFNSYDEVVRASCNFATNDSDRTEYVIIATTERAYALRVGAATQEIAYPANESIESTDDASLLHWMGSVWLFRGYGTAAAVAIASITRAATTATCTTASNHGLATNDWVFIQDVTALGYAGIVQVTVTGVTTFTYTVDGGLTTPATLDGGTVRACKRPLKWDGEFANDFVSVTTGALSTTTGTLIHLPPVPWAIDVGGEDGSRLAVPFKADQIVISDPFDPETLDLQYNEFRLRYGSFDAIKAAVAAQQNVVFVLCRRSLHRLLLADLSIAASEEITRDIGCAARNTVRQWGDQIVWVGDRAVHRVRVTGELSLLPEKIPLSDDVQDRIDGCNWSEITRATAVVWNNRYYLALPPSGEARNTLILIFNFLLNRWETQDEYPSGFDVVGWHVMDNEGEQRLFAATTYGLLYLMEEGAVDTFGNALTQQDYDVEAEGRTRYYSGGTREVKRCRRMHAHVDVPAAAVITAQVVTQNPDHTGDLVTIDETAAEDGRYPIYAGLNGSGAQLRFTLTALAELRAVECEFSDRRARGYDNQT